MQQSFQALHLYQIFREMVSVLEQLDNLFIGVPFPGFALMGFRHFNEVNQTGSLHHVTMVV